MRDGPMVKVARALADETRLKMLRRIRAAGEMTCSQVCERFALTQPTISHHIGTLAEAGLVRIRKQGQFHVLSVREEVVGEFLEALGSESRRGKRAVKRKRSAASANSKRVIKKR